MFFFNSNNVWFSVLNIHPLVYQIRSQSWIHCMTGNNRKVNILVILWLNVSQSYSLCTMVSHSISQLWQIFESFTLYLVRYSFVGSNWVTILYWNSLSNMFVQHWWAKLREVLIWLSESSKSMHQFNSPFGIFTFG